MPRTAIGWLAGPVVHGGAEADAAALELLVIGTLDTRTRAIRNTPTLIKPESSAHQIGGYPARREVEAFTCRRP
jgi:hypothetical protein